jgi:hypothetical protein
VSFYCETWWVSIMCLHAHKKNRKFESFWKIVLDSEYIYTVSQNVFSVSSLLNWFGGSTCCIPASSKKARLSRRSQKHYSLTVFGKNRRGLPPSWLHLYSLTFCFCELTNYNQNSETIFIQQNSLFTGTLVRINKWPYMNVLFPPIHNTLRWYRCI